MSAGPVLPAVLGWQGVRRDPLRAFRWMNAKVREAVQALVRGLEVYLHGSNACGKTYHLAALFTAICRGWRELDGVELPVFPSPCSGILIVAGTKQGSDSSIEAFRALLGSHPYHEVLGSQGTTAELWIKPDDSPHDDWRRWSKISVYAHGSSPPKGLRRDWVWSDEPVPIPLWEECLARPRADGPFFAIISATPLYRDDHDGEPGWLEILKRFEHCLGEPDDRGRIRFQTGLRDNKALSAKFIRRFEATYAGTALEAARLRGEHVDVSGHSPFPPEVLAEWLKETREPDSVQHLRIRRELGLDTVPATVRLDCWGFKDAPPRDTYLVVVDPASGTEHGDPDGLHVWSVSRRALVARASARVGAYGIGVAAVRAARLFGNASIELLATGGWGQAAMTAFRAENYMNVRRGGQPQSANTLGGQYGTIETHAMRQAMVGAVQATLIAHDAEIPSRDVIRCFADCRMDATGRIAAGAGAHDEDLVLAGRALQLIAAGYATARRRYTEPTSEQTFRDAYRRTFGVDLDRGRCDPFSRLPRQYRDMNWR